MKQNGLLYKKLSQDEFVSLNLGLKREFFYVAENDIKVIKERPFDDGKDPSVIELIDDDFEWNPKEQPLYMNVRVTANNLDSLFGNGGVCESDATLGVGIIWKPNKSRIKRCVKICDIAKGKDSIDCTVKDVLIPNCSSNIDFSLVIYIVSPGKISSSPYIANEAGMIMYSSRVWTVVMEGEGSIFPIIEIDDENGPIWSYSCDVVNINEDAFDMDHVRVTINRKHPAYAMLCHKNEEFSERYLNEVLSTAVSMIILDLRNKQINRIFDLDESSEDGSVMQVIKYYANVLHFKVNDEYPELLSSVKTYFDKGV